mgnify:CR=1 FL=1
MKHKAPSPFRSAVGTSRRTETLPAAVRRGLASTRLLSLSLLPRLEKVRAAQVLDRVAEEVADGHPGDKDEGLCAAELRDGSDDDHGEGGAQSDDADVLGVDGGGPQVQKDWRTRPRGKPP